MKYSKLRQIARKVREGMREQHIPKEEFKLYLRDECNHRCLVRKEVAIDLGIVVAGYVSVITAGVMLAQAGRPLSEYECVGAAAIISPAILSYPLWRAFNFHRSRRFLDSNSSDIENKVL